MSDVEVDIYNFKIQDSYEQRDEQRIIRLNVHNKNLSFITSIIPALLRTHKGHVDNEDVVIQYGQL